MEKFSRPFMMTLVLLIMAVACNIPTTQVTTDEKTVTALSTLTTEDVPTGAAGTTPSVDATILAAVTVTSQVTSTSEMVTITSSEDTNCRKGPGTMYDILGKLVVGQTSEVVARYQSPTRKYWLIKNPGNPNQECWVWEDTTKVNGDVNKLPDATPPPTPEVTLNLSLYATISPITYSGGCPVSIDLIGSFTVNAASIISYQWYIGDLLVSSGAVTAGSSGTYSSSDQITITSTTTNPIRLRGSAGAKTVTTNPISFSIVCN